MTSELSVSGSRLCVDVTHITRREIAGVSYVLFETDKALGAADIRILGRLSFLYALFEVVECGQAVHLAPVPLYHDQLFDDRLGSMLKYSGKTNENFTRMLLNLAVFSSPYSGQGRVRLLDPVAGKGTALFEGLICGYDACGIEIGSKVVLESYHFLKKHLERERYKHTQSSTKFSGANKLLTAQRCAFEIARDKAGKKSGAVTAPN